MTAPDSSAISKEALLADTTAELSCRSYSQLLLFHERNYDGDVDAAIARAGTLDRAYLLEPNNFTSCDYAQRLADELVRSSGDPDFMRKAGLASTTPESFGFVYYLVKALGTPRLAITKVVEVAARFNRAGEFRIDAIQNDFARVTYRSKVPERNRHLCEGRLGQIASLPTMWNLPAAKAVELECQVNGAEACRYEFRWREPVYPRLAVLPGLAGLVGGALLQGLDVATGWLLPSLGLFAGASAGLAWLYRKELRSRELQLESQYESVLRSMHDLERRHVEISELNASLEQRVGERTRELEQAHAKIQTALDKQLELDRLKTQFFQNISHELRTPLTLILAPLDSIGLEEDLTTRARQQVDVARRSAVRLLGLINQLLDLSRLEAGRMRLALEDTDPAVVVHQLVEHSMPLAQQRGIELVYEGSDSLGLVPLDVDKFEKCVLNLISNALKFTGAEPGRPARVTVSTGVEERRLKVRVADTGIGIPPHELENVFDRFHQVDGSDERRFGGTGIGLSLVREFMTFHCGSVTLESALGVGSTFTLDLPTERDAYPEERLDRRRAQTQVVVDRRSEAARRKLQQLIANPADLALADIRPGEQPAPVVEVNANRPTILVADDNRDMLSYLATILGREYQVLTAENGEEAYDLAVRHLPQVVVSDVMMPRKNGHALVRDLRRNPATKALPVILVTAKADVYQRVQGLEEGADDYVTKPFNFLELRARIRQLLKSRALERSLADKTDYLAKLNFDLVLSKKEVFLQTIEALSFALEAKDRYTHGHSRRVSLLALDVGRHMGLTDLELERVRISAVLHDIGKLGIPEHILRKEGRLDASEERIIQRHPEIGFRILESVKDLAEVNRCILLHHERFDGGGYPKDLKGIDIPLESRIISVADTYDAMTSDRPYRKGLGHRAAIEELMRFSGTQFDPACVKAFLELHEARAPVFPEFPSVLDKLG